MDDQQRSSSQPKSDASTEVDADEEHPLPLSQTGEGETADDPVDDASADSFPASDPPSYTKTTTD